MLIHPAEISMPLQHTHNCSHQELSASSDSPTADGASRANPNKRHSLSQAGASCDTL